jgi:predicted HTH domain antitoxin
MNMSGVVTTRVPDDMLDEIDFLSKEKHMDRATFLRNLISKGLSIEKKERTLRLYKERKISLEKAASILGIDIVSMIDTIKEEELHLDYTSEELEEDLRGLRDDSQR